MKESYEVRPSQSPWPASTLPKRMVSCDRWVSHRWKIRLSSKRHAKQLEEDQRLRLQAIELPSDLPLPHHTYGTYGPKMIAAADDWIWFADHSNQ